MKAIFLIMLIVSCMAVPAYSRDKSNDILLLHAATRELGTNGYSYGTETNVKYIAEFLWGLLEHTPGYGNVQVDFQSEGYAHSLADIYYDPKHSVLRATVSAGYRNVILLDSEQAYPYPEVLYEGCRQLSKLVLSSGSVPMLMMYRSSNLATAQLGEYVYRAGNGCGVEVVPAAYAMDLAGLGGRLLGANGARQAWISACSIYTKITGLNPVSTTYTPAYGHFEWVDSQKYAISAADATSLASFSSNVINTHRDTVHYHASYENDGSVVYRTRNVSAPPFNNIVRYFYKGSSTHEFTSERIDILLNAPGNAPMQPAVHFLGNQNFNTRNWTVDDLALRAGTFATYPNQGLFLYVGGSEDGANAQDIISSNQANLVPLVFDWIKSFGSTAGTATTEAALNSQDCADLWDHYHLRGWKTIPLTVGLGRLNEIIPDFVACQDLTSGAHSSDPLLYMNASMMLASSLGRRVATPDTLPIRKGAWTHAQLTSAIDAGHDLIKELAYMSETSAHVPDSNLTITTKELPVLHLDVPFSHQLSASGGNGNYQWELTAGTGLPDGITLSTSGLLSGSVTQGLGIHNVAFKVTDAAGAFRKVGLKLKTSIPVGDITASTDIVAIANTNYGINSVATMLSPLLTAPDRLATFRIAISVDPMEGTSITSGTSGDWGINSGETASGWWNTFDGSLSQAVDSISTIRIVDFNANGGNLAIGDFKNLSFKSVTILYGNNSADRVKVIAGGIANASGGLKMASSPASIDLHALAGSTPVISFTLANGSAANSSDRWSVQSIQVEYTIHMPSTDAFATWASNYGLEGDHALPGADPENGGAGDGYTNLLEFALGMNPTLSDARSRESIQFHGGADSPHLIYAYERRADFLERGLSYTLIPTSNLATPSMDPPDEITIGDPVNGFETVTTRYPMNEPTKFIQLKVQLDAPE